MPFVVQPHALIDPWVSVNVNLIRDKNQAHTAEMVNTESTVVYYILLDSGGRTSIRNDCKSYNGETSREKKDSVPSWFVRHAREIPLVVSAHTFCTC